MGRGPEGFSMHTDEPAPTNHVSLEELRQMFNAGIVDEHQAHRILADQGTLSSELVY